MYIQVRFLAAPLKIEEIESVISAVFKGMSVPFNRIIFAGCPEQVIQICRLFACYCHLSCLEVDIHLSPVMDTAGIAYQHAVNVDPHVIIAGEFKLHRLQLIRRAQHLSPCRHGKLRIDMHAHPEVSLARVLIVERPEAAHPGITGGLLSNGKCFVPFIKAGIVVTAVKCIVAILVDIHQLVYTRIRLSIGITYIRIKQIRQ